MPDLTWEEEKDLPGILGERKQMFIRLAKAAVIPEIMPKISRYSITHITPSHCFIKIQNLEVCFPQKRTMILSTRDIII